jgi:hypothetical protein
MVHLNICNLRFVHRHRCIDDQIENRRYLDASLLLRPRPHRARAATCGARANRRPSTPNAVLIMTDDMGVLYSPTRAGLVSGPYQQRYGAAAARFESGRGFLPCPPSA